jgi:hypothetical protein
MPSPEVRPDEAVDVLRRTPALLRALLEGLGPGWLHAWEGPDTFGAIDVLGHLILGEQTDWIPRIRIMLEHGESRPFTPFERFGFREIVAGRSPEQLLETFARLRAENLASLRELVTSPEDLERAGTHPGLGRVTIGQILAAWVVHDLGHVKQVVRVMSKRYASAVGPWREYLTILDTP